MTIELEIERATERLAQTITDVRRFLAEGGTPDDWTELLTKAADRADIMLSHIKEPQNV